MAKKILCVIALMLAFVSVLTACDSNGNNTPTPENPAHTHSYGEWETTKAATCTEEGSKERYCSCGEKQTAAIAVLAEHTYGEWETTKAPSYTEAGVKTRYCACGDSQTEAIAKLEEETVTITSLQCKNEIQAALDQTAAQKNLWFATSDESEIFARYFDGDTYRYYNAHPYGPQGTYTEEWAGKVGDEYLYFNKHTNADGTKTYRKMVDVTNIAECFHYGYVNTMMEEFSLIYLISNSTAFECLKTVGEKTTYQIKMTSDGVLYNVTLTVKDGLFDVLEMAFSQYGEFHSITNFYYDKEITLPKLEEYPLSDEN